MLAAGDDDLAGVQRKEPKVRRALSVSSGAYRVKHSSHLNSELDFCFSKCSYQLCCVLVMDIVYKWKQKKYKQPKKQVRNRKIHIAIHLLFTYPSTKHGEPHQKKWNLRCYGVQALKQVIAIDKDAVLQHS